MLASALEMDGTERACAEAGGNPVIESGLVTSGSRTLHALDEKSDGLAATDAK